MADPGKLRSVDDFLRPEDVDFVSASRIRR
jgi:hypothetical protein